MFSYYFFCLRVEFFTRVNPPLGKFTHKLIFFPSKISLLNFTTYIHTQNICLQFEFDLLFTLEKILDKILGYDFTLKKPTVYDHGKNIGQDFWIRL